MFTKTGWIQSEGSQENLQVTEGSGIRYGSIPNARLYTFRDGYSWLNIIITFIKFQFCDVVQEKKYRASRMICISYEDFFALTELIRVRFRYCDTDTVSVKLQMTEVKITHVTPATTSVYCQVHMGNGTPFLKTALEHTS